MAYPTKYTRQYDFASYQNSNPSRPLPADKVNADYNAVQNSIGEIVEFLKGFSRADKKLANKSVGRDQLADNVPLSFDTPTAWAAASGSAGSSGRPCTPPPPRSSASSTRSA